MRDMGVSGIEGIARQVSLCASRKSVTKTAVSTFLLVEREPHMPIEKSLAYLDGADAGTRVELVQIAEPNVQPTLEMRLQRYCGDLGWLTHKRITLAAGQIPDLRDALNHMDRDAQTPQARKADKVRTHRQDNVIAIASFGRFAG